MSTLDKNPARKIDVARIYRPDGTSEKLALPSCGGTDDVVRLLAGEVREDVIATLPTAVHLARRIVPWADAVLAPRVLLIRDPIPHFPTFWLEGLTCIGVGGVASKPLETIYLSISSTTPAHLLEATCHECWHLIEDRLSMIGASESIPSSSRQSGRRTTTIGLIPKSAVRGRLRLGVDG